MGLVGDKQKMKKETNKINIIKFNKIFVLFCFSFFSIFSFSDASIIFTAGGTGYELNADNDDYVFPDSLNSVDFSATVSTLSTSTPMYVNFWYKGGRDSGHSSLVFMLNNSGGSQCLQSYDFDDEVINDSTYHFYSIQIQYINNSICDDADFYTQLTYTSYGAGEGMKANIGLIPYFSISTEELTAEPTDDESTRINLISPINNATTTSPVELEVQYYINSETNGNIEKLFIDYSVINGVLVSGTQGINVEINNIIYDQLITATTTITLPTNQIYTWNARLTANEDSCNNPLLSVIWCAFQSATSRSIASTQNKSFVIGNNPLDSIENFGNSLFDASGGDSNLLGGGCAFVATSTCAITDPTSYGGCFTNSLIVVLCPSVNTIHYATSTLMNSFYNKMPFGFFIQPYVKISELVNSTTTTLGQDVTVNIDVLGNGTTTIFSWSEAKNFMDNSIGEGVINTLMIIELVGLTFYAFYRLIGLGKNNDNVK